MISNSLKVLMISGDYPPMISGMGDYAYSLANALQRLDLNVLIITSKTQSDPHDAPQGPRILRTVPAWNKSGLVSIQTAVEIHRPDVIHLQYMNFTFQNQWAIHFAAQALKRKFKGVKIVTTFHEFAAPLSRALLLPILLGSDAFIVTNDHHFRRLRKITRMLFLKQPVHRIPLGSNIPPVESYFENREMTRQQLGFGPGEIVLTRFGILHQLSVPEIVSVLSILEKLRVRGIPAKLLLIGKEDSGLEILTNAIRSRNLQDFVSIKTNLSRDFISAYLFASDIGLALYPDGVSEKRTALLSLLEHGLPVVGIRTAITPSEFVSGKNIVTLKPHASEDDWCGALQNLAENSELRKKLGSAAALVSRLHRWPLIAESTKNLYRRLLSL